MLHNQVHYLNMIFSIKRKIMNRKLEKKAFLQRLQKPRQTATKQPISNITTERHTQIKTKIV